MTTQHTTASGAANAGLHALADRIEEAQGRAICISVESANYLRKALTASAPAPQSAPAVDAWTVLNVGGWPVSEGVNSSVAQGMLTAERIELGWRAVPAAPKVDHIASLLPR